MMFLLAGAPVGRNVLLCKIVNSDSEKVPAEDGLS